MSSALRQLGLLEGSEQPLSRDELMARGRVVPRYEQLFGFWLDALVAAGRLDRDARARYRRRSSAEEPGELRALAAEARRSSHTPEIIDLVERCGGALGPVLRGELAPVGLFAAVLDGSGERAQAEFGLHTHYKSILRAGLEHLVDGLPASTRLRVIEIGGGTGIATTELLRVLPRERTTYVFTDIARLFLTQARQKFGGHPFITYGLLDIEVPPVEQGYLAGSFDLVVAANVLHAARDMDRALSHARWLLAPGGLLLVGEKTQPTLDFAITYSLLMNPVADAGRDQGNPFLDPDGWHRALAKQGFSRAALYPETDLLEQNVVVAQASAVAAGSSGSARPAFTDATSAAEPGAAPPAEPLAKKADIADWFHVPSWRRRPLPPSTIASQESGASWLLFVDRCGVARRLAADLADRGHDVILVEAGTSFRRDGDREFAIDPRRPEDHESLLRELDGMGRRPRHIVHAFSVTGEDPLGPPPPLDETMSLGLFSLLYLAQAWGRREASERLDLWLLSSGAHEVLGEVTVPAKAMTLSPCKVIPLEYPNVSCRGIDVWLPDGQATDELIARLGQELHAESPDRIVAYRGAHRWVHSVEPVRLTASAGEAGPRLRERGAYLITGGLGKIGLALAGYLARTVRARLVLTQRSPFPSEDDPRGQIAGRVRELEELGSEVEIVSADVANVEQMRAAASRAQARFGPIRGLIHCAGALGDGSIQAKTRVEIEEVLAAKVKGTLVLDAIFADADLDFFVLCSSLSAIKPGFGQVAYAAANNFVDSFVHSRAAARYRSLTALAWDVWQGEGMAYDASGPRALQKLKEDDFKRRGLLPEEGIEVFRRALGSGLRRVLVSTSNYLDLLEADDRDLSLLYLETLQTATSPGQARPDLTSEFAAPENETERALAEIWQELLGVRDIGVHDDFFELGGDSLIGTQVITRIRRSFGVTLSTRTVYSHATIRRLAEAVAEALLGQVSADKLEQVLKKLG